jgi:RAB protein geranylgeranyltransferase component A
MEKVITIPKELVKKGELVIIPRVQYEEYLRFKKAFPFGTLNASDKKAVEQGRKEIKQRKYLTLKQLKNELGC